MVVLSYKTIRDFFEGKNETINDAFRAWYKTMERNEFANLSELKMAFRTVDYAGNQRYVFNILGNHYRIITVTHFQVRTVYILFIGTHNEYNKIDVKNYKFKK